MVLRLVIDAVRRKWLTGVFAVFQLHLMFQIAGKIWPSMNRTAWAMAAAWLLSGSADLLFASRELYQLPVSRRTWWLARWWMCVVAPAAVVQLAVAITQWRDGTWGGGVEQIVLTMTFVVLYCGCGVAARTTSLGKSADAPATLLSTVAFAPAFLAFITAPFLLAGYLPHTFADLHGMTTVVMLVAAAVTVVGYRYEPTIEARPYKRLVRRLPPIPSSAAPATEKPPTGFVGRLTGAKLVLWEECRKQFLIFSTMTVLGVVAWAVASRFRAVAPLGEVFHMAGVLPFSSPRAVITEPIMFGALLAVTSVAEGWLALRIRSLRTLPLSSAQLSSLPVVLGLVSTSMLWMVLLALHGLMRGTLPASLRPDLFVAFAALSATAQLIRFAAPGQAAIKGVLGFAPVAIIWLTLGYFGESWRADVVQRGMLIGGVLTLAASWAVMRLAVTRSSSMYRPRSAVVGGI